MGRPSPDAEDELSRPEPASEPPAADRVAQHYRLERLLGRGGTAHVYEGCDLRTGERVAIKEMSLQSAGDWKPLELFERGTALLSALDHPQLPKVLAFERTECGRLRQVRTLYGGGSLESRVRVDRATADRKQIHFLLRDMLHVLAYLHARVPSIVHRDIKPSNILFSDARTWRPALVDFDTAAAGTQQRTGTTIVVSPGYTAPEQLAGDAQPASDLYSLGMTIVFMLTHRDPMDLPRERGKVQVEEQLASLEPATRRVVSRLIEPDLTRRYASAREALVDLEGRSLPSEAAPPQRSPLARVMFTELEMAGVSLFRIAVGVLLGVILGYFFLVIAGRTLWSGDDVVRTRGISAEQAR